MVVRGEALLRAALSEVVGPVNAGQEDHLQEAAELAPFHLDSLDQRLLAGGASFHDVTLAAGQGAFTWGPGGDVDGPPPGGEPPNGGVVSWSRIEEGQEIALGALTDRAGYQGYFDKDTRGVPVLLYRDRSGAGSSARFLVLPVPDAAYTLRLYATIPALRGINRNTTYDLPDGVAAWVMLSLADFLVPHFGLEYPGSLAGKLMDAERTVVQSTRSRTIPRADTAWLRAGRRTEALIDGF